MNELWTCRAMFRDSISTPTAGCGYHSGSQAAPVTLTHINS